MKKFAAITMMLLAISCRSSQKGEGVSSPTLASQHEEGVASMRTSPTMADLVTIEADMRELREVMRIESGGESDLNELEVMRGSAVLAAQNREDELRLVRIAELDDCLRRIAKVDALVAKGADVERIIQSLRSCIECAENYQTEDFLLKTEGYAGMVQQSAKSAIARLRSNAG